MSRQSRNGIVLPAPLTPGGQIWAWEAFATGSNGQAVKLSVMEDHEANATESADMKSQASGLYRRRYIQWATGMDFMQRYVGGKPPQGDLLHEVSSAPTTHLVGASSQQPQPKGQPCI